MLKVKVKVKSCPTLCDPVDCSPSGSSVHEILQGKILKWVVISFSKECSNYRTIALISHASKVILKILPARLQQYVNLKLPDVQAGFRKGRETRNQIVFSLKVISLLHSLVAFKIISLVHIYLVLLNYRTIALISHASKVMLKIL